MDSMTRLEALGLEEKEIAEGPWCEDWLGAGIRHLVKNCDLDCRTHTLRDLQDTEGPLPNGFCEGPSKYDGTRIARLRNGLPALLKLAYAAVKLPVQHAEGCRAPFPIMKINRQVFSPCTCARKDYDEAKKWLSAIIESDGSIREVEDPA